MHRSLLPALAVAAMALPVLAGGCISTKTDSAVADRLDSLGLSLVGIRQANLRTAYATGLVIENAADSILGLTTDRRIRANAYIWKMYAIPAVRQIYSEVDPVAVSFDALAFAIQCEQYFDTGIGQDRFGELQLVAIQAAVYVQDVLTESLRNNLTQANFDTILTLVDAWALDHPLENHFFTRRSISRHLDSLLAERDQSIGSAIGRIADNVDDLSGRLALVSGQLPREGRWQAEFLLNELDAEQRLATLDTTVALLAQTLAGIEETLRTGKVTADITGLRSLHADLQQALDLVAAERAAVLADVERQRRETIAAVEALVGATLDGAADRAEAAVDRALWRVALLLVVAFLGMVLLLFLARALWRPARR